MFGGNERMEDLQRQIDELRRYCLKFTEDANAWAGGQIKFNEEILNRVNKLEEDAK